MLLWIGFALLAAVVVAALLRPLLRPLPPREDAAAADLAVYRDQLTEIETERERGLIAPADAEAARAEIARRLIARAESAQPAAAAAAAPSTAPSQRHPLAYVIAAVLPIASAAIYVYAGRPDLPAQPFATRAALPASHQNMEQLLTKVEERLRNKPDDGEGWEVVAPVYLRMGRAVDARQAYSRAIALLGETPRRLMGFAEASMVADNGMVSDAARHAFERVAALEPDKADARIWLAYALEQDGKLEEAKAAYKAILAKFSMEASWRTAVTERLSMLESGVDPSQTAGSGAGQGQGTAQAQGQAQGSAAEQQAMIERMVEGLASRLKADGRDLGGWQRLVRSYAVLGRRDDALAALASARSNFANDSAALADLDTLAKSVGLAPTAEAPKAEAPGAAKVDGKASAGEQQAMIERMVEGLAARLKTDGRDLAGWQRLVRSYTVLGKRDEAVAALGTARSTFANDSAALADLDKLARSLGL